MNATFDPKPSTKPKGFIHWVNQPPSSSNEDMNVEVRLYDHLFKSEDPGSMDKWLEDMDKDSLHILIKILQRSTNYGIELLD